MPCPLVRRSLCHAARDHYIEHHLPRYVLSLTDGRYQRALNLSEADARRELTHLHHKHAVLLRSSRKALLQELLRGWKQRM